MGGGGGEGGRRPGGHGSAQPQTENRAAGAARSHAPAVVGVEHCGGCSLGAGDAVRGGSEGGEKMVSRARGPALWVSHKVAVEIAMHSS